LLLFLARLAPLACNAEEWHISNAAAVHGIWRIAEIEFYTDQDCTQAASVVPQSLHVAPLPAEKVWKADIKHAGQDCSTACDTSHSAYCNWCGPGNGCCKRDAEGSPAECHGALGYTTEHHQCVALAPKGPLTQQTLFSAFDKDPETVFEAKCSRDACPPGAVTIGAALAAGSGGVRCIVIVKPPGADDAHGSGMFQLRRNRRDLPRCPGVCRSGRYMEDQGGPGVCTQHLGQNGWCGTTDSHRAAGINCGGCAELDGSWEVVGMPSVDTETREGGMLAVRLREQGAGQQQPVGGGGDGGAGAGLPVPAEPPQPGADCWVQCNGRAGKCKWCGEDGACCKVNQASDPPECKRAKSFKTNHHECVKLAKVREIEFTIEVTPERIPFPGQDCWVPCGAKSGHCNWCGPGNACCKRGSPSDPKECQKAHKFTTNHHECVNLISINLDSLGALSVSRAAEKVGAGSHMALDLPEQHQQPGPASSRLGMDCWGGCAAGYCAWCGQGNACCKFGSGSPAECQRAISFTTKHHECVRLAAPITEPGRDCWDLCAFKSGYCAWCGHGNACCRRGTPNDVPECQRAASFLTSHHECVAVAAYLARGLDVRGGGAAAAPSNPMGAHTTVTETPQSNLFSQFGQNVALLLAEGVDCWQRCASKSGFCARCGEGRACCKKGRAQDAYECRRGLGYKTDHHECVRLAPVAPMGTGGTDGLENPRATTAFPSAAKPDRPRTEVRDGWHTPVVDEAAKPKPPRSMFARLTESAGRSPARQLWLMTCIISATWGAACTGIFFFLCRRKAKKQKGGLPPQPKVLPPRAPADVAYIGDDDEGRQTRKRRGLVEGREVSDGTGAFQSMAGNDEDSAAIRKLRPASPAISADTAMLSPPPLVAEYSLTNEPPLDSLEELEPSVGTDLDLEDIYDAKWG